MDDIVPTTDHMLTQKLCWRKVPPDSELLSNNLYLTC